MGRETGLSEKHDLHEFKNDPSSRLPDRRDAPRLSSSTGTRALKSVRMIKDKEELL